MGILWRFSGTIQRADDDTRQAGALAYFYDGGTTTPRTTYTTAALTVAHTHPIVADANGRWPNVYLQYGTYRERITSSSGSVASDADNIPNPEPPTADPGVADEELFTTGRGFWSPFDETITGFVRCNGRTIGSASSGATERAHADCQDLFLKLHSGLSDSICPVGGGRGASAALDWAANKAIAMPDMRGVVPGGLDTMGNSAGSTFDAVVPFITGSSSTPGSTAGLNHHLLTSGQVPVITPAGTISQITPAGSVTAAGNIVFSSSGTNSYTPTGTNASSSLTGGTTAAIQRFPTGAGSGTNDFLTTINTGSTTSYSVTGTAAAQTFTGNAVTATFSNSGSSFTGTPTTPTFTGSSFGSGEKHNTTQRTMLGTFYMKL